MGKMFTTKKRVSPVFVEDTDKTMFAEVCPAYGLPADFYEMGAMDELGFYYVLKALRMEWRSSLTSKDICFLFHLKTALT